ncbi:MAG TPA: 50S ribosomal protein L21 [Candidatus Omnitrophota bacterium]|nr:50S ribosomal protein L21 [Candidatus Omnitrophota bacterium]
MYAVIEISSSQFKVAEGDMIEADRIDEKEGKNIKLEKVLLFAKGSDIRVGQPYLKDVKVEASVVKHHEDSKVIAFKFRRRKHFANKKGQRHQRTTLSITKIIV